MPRSELMIDSLAEHVPEPVSTNTRVRLVKKGSDWPPTGWLGGAVNPCPVPRNGSGRMGCPVTGSKVGYLSLKDSFSNVFPLVLVGPAIMNASSLAMSRNPPPL